MEKVFKPMLLKEDFFPILEIPVIMEEETKGTTINIKIHSASGMDYIKLVQLT